MYDAAPFSYIPSQHRIRQVWVWYMISYVFCYFLQITCSVFGFCQGIFHLKLHICVINSSDILCKNPWLSELRGAHRAPTGARNKPMTKTRSRDAVEISTRGETTPSIYDQFQSGQADVNLNLIHHHLQIDSWHLQCQCHLERVPIFASILLKIWISNEQWRLPGCVPPGLHIRSGKVGRTFYVLRDMMIKIKIIFQESPVSTSSCLIQFTPEATSLHYTLSGMHHNHT